MPTFPSYDGTTLAYHDTGVPAPAALRYAALFDQPAVVVQEGAGHFPWLDDPAAVGAFVG